jgi:single-strand DNA-binding protein
MQRLTIIGYLGQDSEVKDLGHNQVINFSVAVSESYINKTTNEKVVNTTWYECAKWGNNTAVAQFLKKGTQVLVEGKPTARSWQKEDGSIVSVLGVSVLNLELLGGAKSENNSATQAQTQASQAQSPAPSSEQRNDAIGNSNTEEHDDLPF